MTKFKYLLLAVTLTATLLGTAQKLTIEEAVLGQSTTYLPQSIDQLGWIPETEKYCFEKDNSMLSVSASDKQKTLFTLDQLNSWTGLKLQAIPQINWISSTVFYFTNENRYYEVDLKMPKANVTVAFPKDGANRDYDSRSKHLAYTLNNNLFVILETERSIAVTDNANGIISGQIISRNEYGINKGTFWNKDGSLLAFYQKDESMVTDYPLTNYKEQPAKIKNIKYPMAGAESEKVSVGIYQISTGKTIFLDINNGMPTDDFYATNLGWGPDNTVYITKLNRSTNELQLKSFSSDSGKEINTLIVERNNKWLEPEHPAVFVPNHDNQFLWFSADNGFHQLCLYNTDGTLMRKTNVSFEITEILDFDSSGENVFVMGRGDIPTESHCFKIKLADMSFTKVTPAQGSHTIQLSTGGKYLIDEYSSLTIPNKIELRDNNGRTIKTLLEAPNPLAQKQIGITEIFTIKTKDGTELYCRTIKPHDFDASKKYPAVVYVYNGPHIQLVQNNWLGGASLWLHCLAEEGFVVFTIDGRGSAHRGTNFEQAIYRQLGTIELEDQLEGVEWLKKQPWVDSRKLAVHGWSYGGFMTTSLMLRKPGTFKVGVAGGSVIDWSLYEIMYTERYMDTPTENPEGYKTADLTNYIKNLQGKLLMIHGADDDVVVPQHAMKFLKASVDNGVQIDFFLYPGHAHNVRGKDKVHLITKIIDYIKENIN